MNADLERLRHKVSGVVLTPTDTGFDAARACWNVFIEQRPDIIVIAQNENDIVAAVNYAKTAQVPVTVQATGHGQPKTCTNGVLINTSNFKSVSIDPSSKTARVGAGAIWSDVIQAAHPHGLAPVSGSSPNVGVVGYTIGGGYGITSRHHGLMIDNVQAFRIVLPNGEVVAVSPDSNSDLFFAVLGGGGCFGIVSEMTFCLQNHAQVFGGSVMFDASRASAVFSAYAQWTPDLPDDVSSALHIMNFPSAPFIPPFLQGRSMVIAIACVYPSLDRAEEWLKPIRSLDGAEFDSFRLIPYTESGAIYQDPVDPLPVNGRGVLLHDFTQETAASFLKAIGPLSKSPNLMIQLRHLGGAITHKGDLRACIQRNRQAKYLTYLLGVPSPENPPTLIAEHAEGVFKAIEPWILSRGPLNWLGEGQVEASSIKSVFSDDEYSRIWKVKQALDPGNRFANAGLGIN